MWNKPWTIREGLAIGGGLIIIGQLLQFLTGGIDWQLFAFPANLFTLGFFFFSLGGLFVFCKNTPFFSLAQQYPEKLIYKVKDIVYN